MTEQKTREESDSLGTIRVPADALWGAQTARAMENFDLAGGAMPPAFIRALGLIKATAARVNGDLGLLDEARAEAIEAAAREVAEGKHDAAFPVDRYQTGSGTSSNMNANEVIARLASRSGDLDVHPNDHVNLGQSSNDTIPTAIHLSALLALRESLQPALAHLATVLRERATELDDVVKTGRTHLMDAMPLTLGQEFGAWATQVEHAGKRLERAGNELCAIAQGGTAIGSGINTHPAFAAAFARRLGVLTGIPFQPAADAFERIAAQDPAFNLSAQCRGAAVVLLKIANDLRWMNSGPNAGLGEIRLAALQPGSSIMPGKVNPVIPEAVAMAAAQVIGLDAAVATAAQSGSFQLNTMLPLVACNLLESERLLAAASLSLADRAIRTLEPMRERLADLAARNTMLVTALNPVIGYSAAAKIAIEANESGRPVIDVARERTDLEEEKLRALLDPRRLTRGGLPEAD